MFEGKNVALILTGGGSRGIAHVGVIAACEELGIKINTIIGASAGALIGIFYGQNKDLEKLKDHFRPTLLRRYKFEQFGWNQMFSLQKFFGAGIVRGIFDLHYTEKFLARTLEVNDFNQLKIPTFVAATNLTDHTGILFGPNSMDHIPVSKALVASCCIPVLFRPVEIEGKYYVDGEIKRPISIDTAIETGADIVIVSDTYGSILDNIAKAGMLDIATEVVNIMFEDKSMRSVSSSQHKYPDKKIILVSPKVGNKSVINSYAYDSLIKAGYDATINALQEVRDGIVGNTK